MKGDKLIGWAHQLKLARDRANHLHRWIWQGAAGTHEQCYKPEQDADATGVP